MTILANDPNLREKAERFHMAMTEAGYPDVVMMIHDGALCVSYAPALKNDRDFQLAMYNTNKLIEGGEWPCFDCWFDAVSVLDLDEVVCPHV